MTWKKGQSGNPNGKPIGSIGKFTTLKASFLNAYHDIGGDEALAKWAKVNKGDFYKMIKIMLPKTVDVEGKFSVILKHDPIKKGKK